jgi:hypothetical protein
MRKCGNCGVGVLPELSVCYGCARSLERSPADLEWRCAACRSGNAGWRTVCYACGAVSQRAEAARHSGGAGYWGPSEDGGWPAPAPVLTTRRRAAMIADAQAARNAAPAGRPPFGLRGLFGAMAGRRRD